MRQTGSANPKSKRFWNIDRRHLRCSGNYGPPIDHRPMSNQLSLPNARAEYGERQAGIPCHVAIIMDGNGRWAAQRGMPRLVGHERGTDNIRRITTAAAELGINYLTLWAFSTDNWRRPREE